MRQGWIKGLVAFLCALSLGLGVFCAVGLMAWNGDPSDPKGFYYSYQCQRLTGQKVDMLASALLTMVEGDGEITPDEQREWQDFNAEHTNLLYVFRGGDGSELATNVPGNKRLQDLVYSVSSNLYGIDVRDQTGEYVPKNYILEHGVADPMTATDNFMNARIQYENVCSYLPSIFWAAVIGCLLGLLLLIYLMAVAGRRPGRKEVVLNWQDRIPYDLYLAVVGAGMVLCVAYGGDFVSNYSWSGELIWLIGFGGLLAGGTVLGLAILLTTATRIKARSLFRNTLIWRACAWGWRQLRRLGSWWKETFGSWDITRRVIIWFFLYLLGTAVTAFTIILAPIYQGAVLYGLCRWLKGWKAIRAGTGRILGGEPDVVIDTAQLDRPICRDLMAHAEQLNDLGAAIDHAVGERMKSERMKSELITNVSHDLKTPLTSIINYVDLLKKEDIQNEKAQEYIEVLDRKSQRLKKLTEDLVEASKASSGALAVERKPLNFCQLVRQALGEYEEKLAGADLILVTDLPEEPLWVQADGRHLWRVLDNLLGNCGKYAMPDTRVYLDLKKWDGNAVLTLKNISKQALNISVDQLMERFVRGDESRTTEGSGLGLSIARSLTELQGGTFSLSVDGDLFKATVRLPLIEPPTLPAEEQTKKPAFPLEQVQ